MRIKRVTVLLVAVALCSISASVSAHHGGAAYDNQKTATIKGVVTAWVWANPHSLLKFDAKDDQGNLVHWVGESNAPYTMISAGVTSKTFRPGDEVTVTLRGVLKSGGPMGRVTKVAFANGQEINMNGGGE